MVLSSYLFDRFRPLVCYIYRSYGRVIQKEESRILDKDEGRIWNWRRFNGLEESRYG